MKIAPNWLFAPPVEIPAELKRGLDGSDFLLECMVRRGITTPEAAAGFLDYHKYVPTLPQEFPELPAAVERIRAAVRDHEVIGVWGDFDVDGQTSTAVLVDTLRRIGADVRYHIPVRGPESHGINLEALNAFLTPSMRLVVTCDTGISEHEAAAYLHSIGVDLIITDHHQIPETLPAALAILNPQLLPEEHSLHDLAGVGVAYKLAEALLTSFDQGEAAPALHDLVALGCIADIAILRAETRYLVQSGLTRMRTSPRLFLAKMAEMLELSLERINEELVGYYIAPRLNAIGRLDDANPVVNFLLSSNIDEVVPFLTHMEALNANRKVLVSQVFQGCLTQIEANPSLANQSILILTHPEWPAGVVGIAASRVAELTHRPVILLTGSPEGTLRGSARSVPGIDITAALARNQDLLLGFGGHPMAAGLSIDAIRLPELRARMQQTVSVMAEEHHVEAELQIETALNLNQVDFDLLADLDRLAPFGPGNPSPVFVAPGLTLKDASVLGRNADHRQAIVEDARGDDFRILWWQGADLPLPEGRFDLAYTAHLNVFKGTHQVQYEWIDFRPSTEIVPAPTKRSAKQRELLDYRHLDSITAEIQSNLDLKQTLIWREGANAATGTCNRTHLEKSSVLVIQSVPPSSALLLEAVAVVKPAKILFLGEIPPEDDLGFFLRELGALLKQAAGTDRMLSIVDLSAKTAVTPELTSLALEWYVAKGRVSIKRDLPDQFSVSQGSRTDPTLAAGLQSDLKRHADEISAFRRYYLKAPLESLVALHEK